MLRPDDISLKLIGHSVYHVISYDTPERVELTTRPKKHMCSQCGHAELDVLQIVHPPKTVSLVTEYKIAGISFKSLFILNTYDDDEDERCTTVEELALPQIGWFLDKKDAEEYGKSLER